MSAIRIVLLCVVAAATYGVLHDLITAHVCVEYFTIGHPPLFVFDTDSPTLLALGWGVVATWWVGVGLGVPLAVVARVGSRPKRPAGSLVRPVATLMLVAALTAAGAGVAGWLLARAGVVFLVGDLVERVPRDRHAAFLADLWAHSASYAVGGLGGLLVLVRVWHSRRYRAT